MSQKIIKKLEAKEIIKNFSKKVNKNKIIRK